MPGTYLLKLSENILGQTCINIWHYISVTGSPVASDLGVQFVLSVLPSIAAIASSDTTYTDLEVKNIATGSDYYVSAFSVGGTRGGTTSNPFDAWGFMLNPGNINQKAGGKRFAGVAVTDLNDGNPVGSILAQLAACALDIGRPLVTPNGNFRPALKSVRCNKSGTPLRCNGTFQAPTYPQINSGTFDVSTTQSSRKWRTSP